MPFALRESQLTRISYTAVCRMCRVFGVHTLQSHTISHHNHRNNITFIIISVVNINKCFVLFARPFSLTLAPALVSAESIRVFFFCALVRTMETTVSFYL